MTGQGRDSARLPGEVLVELSLEDGPTQMRITRADPQARIAAELLAAVAAAQQGDAAPPPDSAWIAVVDGVLTITGVNRTVIYRVGEYDPITNTYEIRWPD